MDNLAFIDGQNLYMSTTRNNPPWKINLYKFRIYLKYKYSVREAYYFLGYSKKENEYLYEEIQKSGFILKFKEHNVAMLGKKKGNVDSEIIFQIMKRLYRKENFDHIVLVSGDGDFKILVDFLIEENKFKTLLFPSKKYASSLYKKINSDNIVYLEDPDVKRKIS